MKNRRFPYGYEMQNGLIVICLKEADTVKQIFSQYLNGKNLKNIAERLTENQIEFLPGEYGWNKSRIKRMIEDERYIGDDTYPAIIDKDIFQKANFEKNSRRTNISPVVTAEKKLLTHKVICADCRRRLLHNTDSRLKNSEKWFCKNEDCKFSVYMTVAELEHEITEILNLLISTPKFTEYEETDIQAEPSLEIIRMENEIERQFESIDFDKNEIQNMILQCATKKYDAYKGVRHITDRLKADFEQSSPLSAFNTRLFDRTVSAITIDKDKKVCLKLKNNKIIRKELPLNDANTVCTEIGQNHTTET
jgi:site-specific DNA recombinase